MHSLKHLIALTLCLPTLALADISVKDAWIPEAPPTAQAMGAFMTIENSDAQVVKVVKASAPNFDRVELHESIEENGMHKMIAQPFLTVPAKGNLELKPGSYHIMLIGVQQPSKAGDVIPIELTLDNGEKITVNTNVYKRKDMMHKMPMMKH
jgi:periplasmic copper chaperone A